VNPSWVPPASIRKEQAQAGNPLPRVVPPGPENPLGDFAMRLGMPGYLIHGTNKPYGVGMRVSHGCVRLYPEDIEQLFARASVGNPVRIINQPYLAGWRSGVLYLEAHAPMQGKAKQAEAELRSLLARVEKQAEERNVAIDWKRVQEILQRKDGIPAPILENTPDFEQIRAAAQAVAHPGKFYGQPVPGPLDTSRWSLDVASFDSEIDAQRVAAMLSHQGPPIPSRPMQTGKRYRVISGPFEDRDEAQAAAQRIRRDFEFDAQPLAPAAGLD